MQIEYLDYDFNLIAFGIELFKACPKCIWIIIDFFFLHFCLEIPHKVSYDFWLKEQDSLAFSVSVILKEKYISLHFLKWRWSNLKE